MTRHPAPLIVELATNASAAMLAAVEEAIRVVAPLAPVELIRIRAMALPRGVTIRMRGPLVAWDAPASATRRHDQAMAAFAAAFEAARAVAGDGGGRA